MTTTTGKITASGRRQAWLTDVYQPISAAAAARAGADGPGAQLTDYARVARRIRTEGPGLSRSRGWRAACMWIDEQMSQTPRPDLGWAVLQVSVFLSHAA